MADLNPNSHKQACSLVHLCAFSQQVICILPTNTSKVLVSISNGS
jgi:hypothetical protein